MLTTKEIQFIEEFVNENFFDRTKLVRYLNLHTSVGNEIFSLCATGYNNQQWHSAWLDDEHGYTALSTADFIRRIPFYFYVSDEEKDLIGNLNYLISSVIKYRKGNSESELEELYQALEYMFYECNIGLNDIFNYLITQTGYIKGDYFLKWNHYLHLCHELNWTDYLPDRFITNYNEALEKLNMPPIIYEIADIGFCEYFYRDGTTITFEGVFPCDQQGIPIMRWIGLCVKNEASLCCNARKSKIGQIKVELTSETTIHALNCYNNKNDREDVWYQIYAGPLTMLFDYEMLKSERTKLKFTQKQVADAVGATVRTYQKWENGETTPDGHYLLRLMNWLDISDIQHMVKYIEQ